MRTPRTLIRTLLSMSVIASSSGCSSPTESASDVPTYVAEITVPGESGLSGFLTLSVSGAVAGLDVSQAPRLAGLNPLGWLVRPLWAQESGRTATGKLMTGDGDVVSLSGTYSGSTFNVSGGGYTVTATVSNGKVSGSATARAGSPGRWRRSHSPPVLRRPGRIRRERTSRRSP